MNRRHALGSLGAVGAAMITLRESAQAASTMAKIPGALTLALDKTIRVDAQSTAVKTAGGKLHIISIGTGTFTLDNASRLKAVLNAGVTQYAEIDYWISVAVFDNAGCFLGSASHIEPVQYVRLGVMPMTFREIELDFGISRTFKDVALFTVAISDREIPKPD